MTRLLCSHGVASHGNDGGVDGVHTEVSILIGLAS